MDKYFYIKILTYVGRDKYIVGSCG